MVAQNNSDLLAAGGSWNLPEGEAKRQAIPSLRGYAYQLQQSLAAWTRLKDGQDLYLEVAEDYATIARNPAIIDETLTAVQVKDTRESGSVTLNSADVVESIERFWALASANTERDVRFVFLTTSPIGVERTGVQMADGTAGLEAWRKAAFGADVDEVRAAIVARTKSAALKVFVESASPEDLRARLLTRISWACGAPGYEGIAEDNRLALIEIGDRLGATPDLAERAVDVLLVSLLNMIVAGGERRVRRGDLLRQLQAAVTVAVPAQIAGRFAAQMFGASDGEAVVTASNQFWTRLSAASQRSHASRRPLVTQLHNAMSSCGGLWIHGATGLGKSMLASLLAGKDRDTWFVLDLRDAPQEIAAERIRAARAAVATVDELSGVIIDDVNTDHQAHLEVPLSHLDGVLRRRGAKAIFTSYGTPNVRLRRAIGLSDGALFAAPTFEDDDACEVVIAHGGDGPRWAKFVQLAGGSGHPQLVDAVAAGLAARGWPADEMERWVKSGFMNEDVETERDAARRRIVGELPANERDLLRRLTRVVGLFDRDLALAVGRTEPLVPECADALDGIRGHWIEQLSRGRLRVSPLVQGLATQSLDAQQLEVIDRAVARHILGRSPCPADLLNTALVHAWSGKDEVSLLRLAMALLQTDSASRANASEALWVLRDTTAFTSSIGAQINPLLRALLHLARHRLITVKGDAEEATKSATETIAAFDAVSSDGPDTTMTVGVALSTILVDEYGFGKLKTWPELVERFYAHADGDPDFGALVEKAVETTGIAPTDFALAAHAIRMPGIAGLQSWFTALDALTPDVRRRRIAFLKAYENSLGLAVDSAWLKEVESPDLNAIEVANKFEAMGDHALGWGEDDLAARCFRAQAVLLDEYAHDDAAAIAALDAAERKVAEPFYVLRQRAKVLWRRKDFQQALTLLTKLADQFEALEPLETAFALREAAISAGELGLWPQAAAFFHRGHMSLANHDGDGAMSIGLLADSLHAQFAHGDRVGAVRALPDLFTKLSDVNPQASRKAHFVHLIVRHLVLWMQAQITSGMLVDGEPVTWVPGAASNPTPHEDASKRPLSPPELLWFMQGRLALGLDIPVLEVLAIPGVQSMLTYPSLAATFRSAIVSNVIRLGPEDEFWTFLRSYADGVRWVAAGNFATRDADIMKLPVGDIPQLDITDLRQEPSRSTLRAVMTTVLLFGLLTEDAARARRRLEMVDANLGAPLLPEFDSPGARPEDDLVQTVARLVARLSSASPVGLGELFVAHLRMWEWLRDTNFKSLLADHLARRLKLDWEHATEHRSALMKNPIMSLPPLRAALAAEGSPLSRIALILLAAQPAVDVRLGAAVRDQLRRDTLSPAVEGD